MGTLARQLAEMDRTHAEQLDAFLSLREAMGDALTWAFEDLTTVLMQRVRRIHRKRKRGPVTDREAMASWTASLALLGASAVLRRFLEHDIERNTEG